MRSPPTDLLVFALGLTTLVAFSFASAVAVPYWDEWEYCALFQGQDTLTWILRPHNEHLLWLHKALTVPILLATKWDSRVLIALGLALYAAGQTGLFLLVRRHVQSRGLRACAAVLLVLPAAWENLTWAWQVQVHLCLFFTVAGLWMLERARPTLAGAAFLLALASFGSGVAAAAGGAGALALLAWQSTARARWAAAGIAAALLIAALVYVRLSPHPPGHPPLLFPWTSPGRFFGRAFAGVGGSLVGAAQLWQARAGATLAVVAVLLSTMKRPARLPPLPVLAAGGVWLLATAMIVLTRGGFNATAMISSRYMEMGALAVLPAFWALDQASPFGRRVPSLALGVTLALLGLSAAPRHVQALRAHRARIADAGACVFRRPGPADPDCASKLYPAPANVEACLEALRTRWGSKGALGAGLDP